MEIDFDTTLKTVVPLGALLLAILVAFRTRSIIKPKLLFSFRFMDEAYPVLPYRLRKKLPIAIFISGKDGKDIRSILIPLSITNPTKRRIGEVTVELTYPKSYYISNREHESDLEIGEGAFEGKNASDIDAQRELLAKRHAFQIGEVTRVRYDIGALRPGEHFGFGELTAIPEPSVAFEDGQYEHTAFKSVLEHMKNSGVMRCAFHLHASIYSDLAFRQDFSVDIVVYNNGANLVNVQIAYVNAYWLGEKPDGKSYFRPYVPLFDQLLPPLFKEDVVDAIDVELQLKVSEEKDGKVFVGSRADFFASDFGSGSLYMPGFNPRKLPVSVTSVDRALQYLGFIKAKSVDVVRLVKVIWRRSCWSRLRRH